MGIYEKVIEGQGKMPRKLKKRIKKMPVGDYCYGSKIGDKGKMIEGRRKYKGGSCPFFHSVHKTPIEFDARAYCSFLHEVDDFLLADQVKICGRYEGFFPEFKKAYALKNEPSQIL